jgi:hypothetical protein
MCIVELTGQNVVTIVFVIAMAVVIGIAAWRME